MIGMAPAEEVAFQSGPFFARSYEILPARTERARHLAAPPTRSPAWRPYSSSLRLSTKSWLEIYNFRLKLLRNTSPPARPCVR
ncbi:hypothetical protein ACRAWD_05170 [Caulobacter segnis]